jgi:uncharacterized membrane protein YraQ (UPF0718 family)
MHATNAVTATPQVRHRSFATTLAIIGALAIALIFWTQQRYPSFIKKLHAGQSVQVKGVLSFDALLPVAPQMRPVERIARTSVNWIWTNRFGMYFAIPFGAVMMTLLASKLGTQRFASPGGNVLCGAVAGMPLGVCANCATPIGQGLLAAGASSRMTVAAMISSPSFNPVVLTMAFVLFPQPLPWERVVVPAILVSLIPWLVAEKAPSLRTLVIPEKDLTLTQQILAFLVSFGRNLLRLFLLTLPWMILAAVLGAIMAEVIPAYGTHLTVSIFGVAAIAVIGTLLPVPMAFDVALPYVLYRSGVPLPYVATLLCTMGPVSIYSLAALGRQLGREAPFRLAIATAGLGCLAGCIAML